ncbi:uncharacterized protein A4U43_C09F9600 [Asparagus officinalis]|uniref:Mannosyl-oligosaccharide glucosidase n=1 Tax=Asparagus officinalis TaxID=4686 RepID=A0A5P1E6N0_ASPOF|nr:uncharacterized protein A4U43_C09F9600 [Asparagus officinalis]
MSGGSRRTTRIRPKPPASGSEPERPSAGRRRERNRDHGPIRLMNVRICTLLGLGFGFLALLLVGFFVYSSGGGSEEELAEARKLMRVVTPLPAPKMMDLPQFQGEHKESLYWGTYRPNVYLGIRARTPKSLIAGLMWIGIKDGQYFLRHVCQDSDGFSTYGWTDHNGRDYGRQKIVDQGLSLTTSFLKEKGHGSGYGGDWAVRINVQNEKLSLEEAELTNAHLFFYLADEGGSILNVVPRKLFNKGALLATGSHKEVGGWELHLKSLDNLEAHHAGFRTRHMHNLTELVQGTLAVYGRRTGQLQLPDASEESSNILIFQISAKLPSSLDIAFVSGTNSKSSRIEERVDSLTGTALTSQLKRKQEEFEEKYLTCFNIKDKVDSEAMAAGKAALGNLLGGIGYFYGQSKISLPKGFKQKDGKDFLLYWPAALFTAVPSRSFFPRGFLWDEGFHQLIIWRWDVKICMDIVGHWLDLINIDGWIPREQILGAEALSKVPEEYVLQHPSNGNPPTLFLLLRDLISNTRMKSFSEKENDEINVFLSRAYIRLGAWFNWFNTTQLGKDTSNFYWHGRDEKTTKELNPKTLTSGLDDYPRASHPNDDERHLDLRCWMLLAANCMRSIGELFETKTSLEKDYHGMAEKLSNFEILNKMHLDDVSGAYFDFGNHTGRFV